MYMLNSCSMVQSWVDRRHRFPAPSGIRIWAAHSNPITSPVSNRFRCPVDFRSHYYHSLLLYLNPVHSKVQVRHRGVPRPQHTGLASLRELNAIPVSG